MNHHPKHGREVREAAIAAGVEVWARLEGIGIVEDSFPTLGDFLLQNLR